MGVNHGHYTFSHFFRYTCRAAETRHGHPAALTAFNCIYHCCCKNCSPQHVVHQKKGNFFHRQKFSFLPSHHRKLSCKQIQKCVPIEKKKKNFFLKKKKKKKKKKK